MWYAKNIYGDEAWYYTQLDAEKFAGIKQENKMETIDLRQDVKEVIFTAFPKESYDKFNALEEIKQWSAKDLKELMVKLCIPSKNTKAVNIDIISDCIRYANGVIDYDKLIKSCEFYKLHTGSIK